MSAPIILTTTEREELTTINDNICDEELMAHYVFSPEDLIRIKNHRKPINRLGYAIQLCYLRHPGWPVTQSVVPPKRLLDFTAAQIGERKMLVNRFCKTYLSNKVTVAAHFKEICIDYGYRRSAPTDFAKVKGLISSHANVIQDRYAIMTEVLQFFYKHYIIPPGISTIEKWIVKECRNKENEICKQMMSQISPSLSVILDGILNYTYGSDEGYSIKSLSDVSGKANPETFNALSMKIKFIDSIIKQLDYSSINPNMLRSMAMGIDLRRRSSLRRSDIKMTYPRLCMWLYLQRSALTDKAVWVSRCILAGIQKKARKKQEKSFVNNKAKIHELVEYYRGLSKSLLMAEQGRSISHCFKSYTNYDVLRKKLDLLNEMEAPDDEFIEIISDFYPLLRQFSPTFIDTFSFSTSNRESQSILNAVEYLKSMNLSKEGVLPKDAPIAHMPTIWKEHLYDDDGEINKAIYETSTLIQLSNHIKNDMIDVIGSETYLSLCSKVITEDQFDLASDKQEVLSIPLEIDDYISDATKKMQGAYDFCSDNYGLKDDLWVEKGHFHLSPLPKEVPEEAEELKELLYSVIPNVSVPEILQEVAKWTGYDKYLKNKLLKGYNSKIEDREITLAALMAVGTNVGYSRMAQATLKYTADRLSDISHTHLTQDTIREAQSAIINFQRKQYMSSIWGNGTTSSSDGMRVRSFVFALNAEHNPHYGFDRGCTMYRFTSDQYYSFEVKVINTNSGEAPHVIDGVLCHETITSEKISEHYTDTGGSSFHVSALSRMFGFLFAPRIKRIHEASLFILDGIQQNKKMDQVKFNSITDRELDILRSQWKYMLRIAYSVKKGLMPASLVLSKISSAKSEIGIAFKIMGKIERSIFLLQYFADHVLRKRIQVGLNKGERLNQLARVVFFGKEGGFRVRTPEAQLQRASSLNIILNAIITWNTVYLKRCIDELEKRNIIINKKLLKHISPLNWQHIQFLGIYLFDDSLSLGENEYRPLNFDTINMEKWVKK